MEISSAFVVLHQMARRLSVGCLAFLVLVTLFPTSNVFAATEVHHSPTSIHLAPHSGRPLHPHPQSPFGCNGGGPGTYTFGNWADNEAVGTNCPRGVYHEAQLQFYVPSISTSDSNARVLFFAGVGGDSAVTSPSVLVQAGVYITVVNGRQHNESMWEVWPYFTIQNLPLCILNAGDLVYMDIQSNLNNDGWDHFYIQNNTHSCSNYCNLDTTGHRSSQGACAKVPGKTSYNSDSASGECVAEQLYQNSFVGYPLAEWFGGGGEGAHKIQLQGCRINSNWINAQSHSHSDIKDPLSGNVLTSIGPIDNFGDFTVTWLGGS